MLLNFEYETFFPFFLPFPYLQSQFPTLFSLTVHWLTSECLYSSSCIGGCSKVKWLQAVKEHISRSLIWFYYINAHLVIWHLPQWLKHFLQWRFPRKYYVRRSSLTKTFFNSENWFHVHEISIFSQQALKLMTLMRPMPYLKRGENKNEQNWEF